jgi:hypothetical protein
VTGGAKQHKHDAALRRSGAKALISGVVLNVVTQLNHPIIEAFDGL